MGRLVDVDDLVDAHEAAELLGLSHANTVHQYQERYPDMPKPVYVPPGRRARLWLRSELLSWKAKRSE